MAQSSETAPKNRRIQVDTADTEELIRLTNSLDDLSTKVDRIGGIVVKLYQLTEKLESTMSNSNKSAVTQPTLDESVIEWINAKIAKKRRKELEKWRKKKGNKKHH